MLLNREELPLFVRRVLTEVPFYEIINTNLIEVTAVDQWPSVECVTSQPNTRADRAVDSHEVELFKTTLDDCCMWVKYQLRTLGGSVYIYSPQSR